MGRMIKEKAYMKKVLRLALKGKGRTHPNPMVGALVVNGGKVIGLGHHPKAGADHAEVRAIKAAGRKARGGTLYINLEPCCHIRKRTPPCVPMIIRAGIRRVVVAMRDPNPKVNGKGIKALRRAGLKVVEGMLKEEAASLNQVYVNGMKGNLPFVILKAAVTMDGKIASGHHSYRITGAEARRMSHRFRNQVDVIMVGIETVLQDDPRLTTRLPGRKGRDPYRVILDSQARTPPRARLMARADSSVLIAVTKRAPLKKVHLLRKRGATVLVFPQRKGRVSLRHVVAELGRRGFGRVLIEGGGEVNASALSEGIVDKLVWFISPRLMGGTESVGVIGGKLPLKLRGDMTVYDLHCRRIGKDFMMEGYLKRFIRFPLGL